MRYKKKEPPRQRGRLLIHGADLCRSARQQKYTPPPQPTRMTLREIRGDHGEFQGLEVSNG